MDPRVRSEETGSPKPKRKRQIANLYAAYYYQEVQEPFTHIPEEVKEVTQSDSETQAQESLLPEGENNIAAEQETHISERQETVVRQEKKLRAVAAFVEKRMIKASGIHPGIMRAASMMKRQHGAADPEDGMVRDRTNERQQPAASPCLPEIATTPPMPTFQRGHGNAAPVTPVPRERVQHRPDSAVLPAIADPGNLLNPRPEPITSSLGRIIPIPPKPTYSTVGFSVIKDTFGEVPMNLKKQQPAWNVVHDRTLCYLDIQNYGLDEMVSALRDTYPELNEGPLKMSMLHYRLLELEQQVDISYFADAIDTLGLHQAGTRAQAKRLGPNA